MAITYKDIRLVTFPVYALPSGNWYGQDGLLFLDDKILDDNHITLPLLTKYEKARVLGLRSSQINSGSIIFTDVDDDEIDGYKIAEKELQEKKIPFIIKRPLPNGKCEYWRLSDLEQI